MEEAESVGDKEGATIYRTRTGWRQRVVRFALEIESER